MSCKDVCLYGGYEGVNDFYSEKTPRAGKPHTCCECGDVIPKGDVHHYASGKSDGVFWDYRTCAACDEIRRTFYCGGGAVFSWLWEDVREQMFPKWNEMTAIDCLARLTSQPAIDKLRGEHERYREKWGNDDDATPRDPSHTED